MRRRLFWLAEIWCVPGSHGNSVPLDACPLHPKILSKDRIDQIFDSANIGESIGISLFRPTLGWKLAGEAVVALWDCISLYLALERWVGVRTESLEQGLNDSNTSMGL